MDPSVVITNKGKKSPGVVYRVSSCYSTMSLHLQSPSSANFDQEFLQIHLMDPSQRLMQDRERGHQ